MNYLLQINAFWQKFNELPDGKPYHISLYFTLCHINNRCGWRKIFNVNFEKILELSRLDKNTYYKACTFLYENGFLELYQKGQNQYESAHFSIKVLSDISESERNAGGKHTECSRNIHKQYKQIKHINNTTVDKIEIENYFLEKNR